MSKKNPLPPTTKAKKSRFSAVGDVVGELRKVVWPTRREATRLSILVLIVCLVVGIVLGAIDYGFAELVTKVFLGGA